MALDYRRLRAVTAREIGTALVRDGFKLARQKGSHQRYVHSDGRRATVTTTDLATRSRLRPFGA